MTQKLKRLLALVLTLAMVLSLLSTGAWATGTEPTDPEEVTESIDPTEAADPTEAVDPTEEEETTAAEETTEPVDPTAAEEPTEAEDTTEAPTEAEELPEVEAEESVTESAAMALAPVPYLKWDSAQKKLVNQTGDNACQTYTEVSDQTTWGAEDTEIWYVVNKPSADNLSISERITVKGTVNLILCDGAKLTASAGITTTGATLNIYAQSEGDSAGSLAASGANEDVGIGGEANSNYGGAGIGGGGAGAGGTVAINGGDVTAIGGGTSNETKYVPAVAIGPGEWAISNIQSQADDSYKGTVTLGALVGVMAGDDENSATDVTATYAQSHDQLWAHLVTGGHEHDFTYTAKGDTITAACGDGCDITEGLTLTVSAPKSLTYDGQPKEATLSTGYNPTAFPGSYSITCTKQGDPGFTGTPTDAGTYTASVTVDSATASVEYTIAPATLTDVSVSQNGTLTYSGQAQTPEVTTAATAMNNQSVTFTGLKVGTTYTVYTRKAADANHYASPASGTKARTLNAAILLQSGTRISASGKTITVKWGKVPGATAYDVYVQYCGEEFEDKPTVTTKNTSVNLTKIAGKAIKTGKNYKVYIVARNGDKVLGKTTDLHGVTSGRQGSFNDPTEIALKKTALTLSKGKSVNLGAGVKPATKQLDASHGALLRYVTSDSGVATVDKTGKVTAKGAGVCTIQVIARNGLTQNVTVRPDRVLCKVA